MDCKFYEKKHCKREFIRINANFECISFKSKLSNVGEKEMIKVLDYDEFVTACKYIAKTIRKNYMDKIDNIFGVPRGGLVLAVYLSHALDLPIVTEVKNARTLVVDDIADTGETLKKFNEFDYGITATIYYHEQSIVEPDIWVYEKRDKWIQFPWENAL